MFYEYAVDPAILTNISNVQAFFESFKNRPYRLIADAPKKWIREAYLAINCLPHDQCPPVMKKTLKENLNKLSKNSLCSNRSVDDWSRTKSWLDYAAREHEKHPFSAILGTESAPELVPVYCFSKLFFAAPPCWERVGQQHIKRNATSMVEAVLPLLKVSKQLLLVDPHFSLIQPNWERYKPLLKGFIQRASEFNFGKGIFKIEIHTSDERGGVQQELDAKVKSWLPEGMTVCCFQWPKKQMHDRFILTDVGGVSFGHGLDEFVEGRLKDVLVSVLDHQSYRTERVKLNGLPSVHSFVENIKKFI
jgi:hypothetical protein